MKDKRYLHEEVHWDDEKHKKNTKISMKINRMKKMKITIKKKKLNKFSIKNEKGQEKKKISMKNKKR